MYTISPNGMFAYLNMERTFVPPSRNWFCISNYPIPFQYIKIWIPYEQQAYSFFLLIYTYLCQWVVFLLQISDVLYKITNYTTQQSYQLTYLATSASLCEVALTCGAEIGLQLIWAVAQPVSKAQKQHYSAVT
jgi:hypothetical protein